MNTLKRLIHCTLCLHDIPLHAIYTLPLPSPKFTIRIYISTPLYTNLRTYIHTYMYTHYIHTLILTLINLETNTSQYMFQNTKIQKLNLTLTKNTYYLPNVSHTLVQLIYCFVGGWSERKMKYLGEYDIRRRDFFFFYAQCECFIQKQTRQNLCWKTS